MKSIKMLFVVAALALCVQANAEDKKERGNNRLSDKQKIEIQCNRIAAELALDDATTAKFIEVYSKYLADVKALRESGKKKNEKKEKADTTKVKPLPTDAEVEARIKARFEKDKKMIDLEEKCYAQLRKFLSPKQIQKVYQLQKKSGKRENVKMQKGKNTRTKMQGRTRQGFGRGAGMNAGQRNNDGQVKATSFRGHGPQMPPVQNNENK